MPKRHYKFRAGYIRLKKDKSGVVVCIGTHYYFADKLETNEIIKGLRLETPLTGNWEISISEDQLEKKESAQQMLSNKEEK